jgi:hypothetical protein
MTVTPSAAPGVSHSIGVTPLEVSPGSSALPSESADLQKAFKNSIESPQRTSVLSNFQVQQHGNAIRLVDQDGSIYDGWLQLAQNYVFHVYGTNLTTKQTVSFTGSLEVNVVSTNSARLTFGSTGNSANAGNGGIGGGGGGGEIAVGGNLDRIKSQATNQVAQLPWADLRITGTAVLSQTNRISIDAAPIAPNKN